MKKGYFFAFIGTFLLQFSCSIWAQSPPEPEPYIADGSHNPADTGNGYGESFNSGVSRFVAYPTGNRYLALGNFNTFNGRKSPGIVRLIDSSSAPNNPIDYSFKGNFNLTFGFPKLAAITPNQKIVVCGDFSVYGNEPVNQIVRLFPDGSLDAVFQSNIGSGPGGGEIRDIRVDANGNIYLAGSFVSFNGSPRNGLAKLDSTGQLDSTFSGFSGPSTAGTIYSIELVGSDLMVAGSFSGFNGNPSYSNFAVINSENASLNTTISPVLPVSGTIVSLKKLSAPGQIAFMALDASGNYEIRLTNFSVSSSIVITSLLPSSGAISDFHPEPTGVLITGSFSSFTAGGVVLPAPGGIVRLTWSGIPAVGFSPGLGANAEIKCIAPSNSPGFYFIGGDFSRFNNLFRGAGAKLNGASGATAALSRGSGANGGPVYCSLVTPDNKIIMGGNFGYFNWNLRNGITRVNSDGTNDPTFTPGTGLVGTVHCLALQTDGKILAGGKFSSYNGLNKNGIVRILSNGSVDPSFSSPALSMDTVFAIAVQKNGKILVGGSFTDYDGVPAGRIIRLQGDGSVDAVFLTNSVGGFNRTVRAISIYRGTANQDSVIFVGGDFSTYKTGVTRRNLVALDTTGNPLSAGTGIDPGGRIQALGIDSAKRELYAGGLFFIQYNGNTHRNIARFKFSLSADTSFKPLAGVDGEVFSILKEAGKRGVFLGGNMGIAKAGGHRGIIKLKPKGSKDLTIGNGVGANGPIFSIKRDKTGKLIFVGNFNKFDSVGKNRILRMLKDPLETTVWDGSEWDWDAPDCGFSAIIAGRYRKPGFNCKNLYVVQNVKFYPHTTNVEVCGDAFCWSSKIDSAESEVYLTGTALQLVEGYFRHLSLDNDSGASVYGPTWIDGTLKLWKGTLNTNNFLTLKSTVARTGRLAKVENNAGLTGNLTLERYVPGGAASWHFLGTPIKNQVQSNWADDFLILPTFMYRHNEASNIQNGWEQSNDSLKVGKGFRVFLNQPFFNSSSKFENTGVPHTGNFNFAVNYTPGGYGGGGWNLLANPYPCETDWHQYNRNNVGVQVHYWNFNQYASYSSATQVGVNGGSRYIPSSQGFFVKATSAGPTLSVTEDAKPLTAQNQSFFRTASEDFQDVARIFLHASGNRKDEAAIRWMPEAQAVFETGFDADKLENPEINLFSMSADGRRSSIQARNFNVSDSIPLGITVTEAGSYFLEIQLGSALTEGKTWKIRDNESGFVYPLNSSTLLPFSVEEEGINASYRFTLLGSTPLLAPDQLLTKRNLFVYPNPGKGRFRIPGLSAGSRFCLQDAGGRLAMEGFTEGELDLNGLNAGVYFIRFPDSEHAHEVLRLMLLP